MPFYKVKKGDCISSIAFNHGFFPDKIWNHPNNADLKNLREDLNVLMEGDMVFIPDKEKKKLTISTDSRHSYKLKGVPAKLCIRFLDYIGEEMANAKYLLDVDGVVTEGILDSNGVLDVSLNPKAKKAKVTIGEDFIQLKYDINLGYLDPWDTVKGIQQRLNNLGFFCGEEDGTVNQNTINAIYAFQKRFDMKIDGELSPQIKLKIKEVFGE